MKKCITVFLAGICTAVAILSGCGSAGINKSADAASAEIENGQMAAGTYLDGGSPKFGDIRLRLTIGEQEARNRKAGRAAGGTIFNW